MQQQQSKDRRTVMYMPRTAGHQRLLISASMHCMLLWHSPDDDASAIVDDGARPKVGGVWLLDGAPAQQQHQNNSTSAYCKKGPRKPSIVLDAQFKWEAAKCFTAAACQPIMCPDFWQ
jgi:hypothetical protein